MSDAAEFVAVEESPEWLVHHREIIPADLLPRMRLIQRGTSIRSVDGVTRTRSVPAGMCRCTASLLPPSSIRFFS